MVDGTWWDSKVDLPNPNLVLRTQAQFGALIRQVAQAARKEFGPHFDHP